MGLNNAYAPSNRVMLESAIIIFAESGEDAVLDYLSEMASNDFSCPDKCDRWAMEFYEDYREEIEGDV